MPYFQAYRSDQFSLRSSSDTPALLASKDIQKNEFKENKYRTKANKLRKKKYGTFTSASKAEELEFRATKLDLKADKLKSKITNTKLQIQKNEEMQKVFNTGLNEVNSLLVRQGRSYLRNLN